MVNHNNLYNQKYKEHLPKFKILFKQILSDRDSASFIPDRFESDQQVFEDIEKIYQIYYEMVTKYNDKNRNYEAFMSLNNIGNNSVMKTLKIINQMIKLGMGKKKEQGRADFTMGNVW